MENNSYGIETLSIDKMQELVNWANSFVGGYWGPIEEKNGRYYLTFLKGGKTLDDVIKAQMDPNYDYREYYEVCEVISKSTSPEEANQILLRHDADIMDNPIDAPLPTYNTDEMNQYIKEVESTLGQEVGRVEIRADGKLDIYDIDGNPLITGTSIVKKSDDNSNNTFDLTDIEKIAPKKETVNITDKVNENNKVIIENYLSQLTGVEGVELKLSDSGYYAEIDGKIITFDKDTTISKAIATVNSEFQTGKSIDNYNKSLASNKLSNRNSQRIFIDVHSFESAQSMYSSAKGFVDAAGTQYNTGCFTDKLAQAYASLVPESPVNDLTKTSNLLATLNSNIKYSLKAYENIDHDLGIVINSIINEIFSTGKYANDETQEFYQTTSLPEREAKLDKIINDLTQRLDGLKKEYTNVATLFNGIALGFNIFNEFGIDDLSLEAMKTYSDGYDDNYFRYVIPGDKLTKLFDFIEQNDVLTKVNNYANGQSWDESGLGLLYYRNENGWESTEEDYELYCTTPEKTRNENKFLKGYLSAQIFTDDPSLRKLQETNCPGTLILEVSEENKTAIKTHMKNQISQFSSDIQNIRHSDEPISLKMSSKDLSELYTTDTQGYQEAIAITAGSLENYKQYKGLMPYEADMELRRDEYLEYLVQDWNKLNIDTDCPELKDKIKYMSQQEMSLYFMYKNTGNEDKAEAYLKAMDDLINRRHGYEMAAERMEKYTEAGELASFLSTTDGLGDGVENFFRGIMNVVFADGKRDAKDYRDIYFMSMIAGDASSIVGGVDDLKELSPAMKQVVKYNYSTWKGVGTALIPTAVSFIPGWGQAASKTLWAAYTFGSSRESALQDGASGADAFAYGLFSAGTSVALNKIMGGIAGLNGKAPPEGATEFLTSMVKQGGRAVTGLLIDKFYRSAILGQPVDLSSLPAESFDAAITGMLTAAAMNGTTKLTIKIADGFIYHFSDKYNNYAEWKADMDRQFKSSPLYKKLCTLKAIGGNLWKQQELRWSKSIVGAWMSDKDENNPFGKSVIELTNEKDSILLKDLQPGQHLLFDGDTNHYYIYDESTGSALTIPEDWISSAEGMPNILTNNNGQTADNSSSNGSSDTIVLDSTTLATIKKSLGRRIQKISDNGNGTCTVVTQHGRTLIVPSNEVTSDDFAAKLDTINENDYGLLKFGRGPATNDDKVREEKCDSSGREYVVKSGDVKALVKNYLGEDIPDSDIDKLLDPNDRETEWTNPWTGRKQVGYLFSSDGKRAVRFAVHEKDSCETFTNTGKGRPHIHLETWNPSLYYETASGDIDPLYIPIENKSYRIDMDNK